MSKQDSIIKFKGKMDGISFYKKQGEYVARKASGPSRERILRDPKFERVRENMSEFTGLALAAGSFSLAFAPVKNLRDTRVRGRISKIYRGLMVGDEASVLGQRQLLLSQARQDLHKFDLNAANALSGMITAKIVASHSADRKTATVTLPDLRPYMVLPPLQSTHFQVVQHVAVLSDVRYDAVRKRYYHVDESIDTISKTTFSEHIPLNGVPSSLTLETTLDVGVLSENVTVVQAIGILFVKKHGTAYYPSNDASGMRIVDAY